MTVLGLDYSSGRPRGSEVKRLGYGFVIRYCGQPGNRKNTTRAEVDDMLAHGVAVALVFESTSARAGQGFNAGVADARAAVAHQAALGIPASRPIYYAVDYDADPATVEPYFRGLNSVAGPDSAYGSFRVVQRLRADGLTVDSWQTVAWSHKEIDPGRDVFQRLGYVTVDGIQCDVNEALTTDFGQYPFQEDDMSADELLNTEITIRNADGTEAKKASVRQILEWTDNRTASVLDELATVKDTLDRIEARPAAAVDAAALAAALSEPLAEELVKLGVAGATSNDIADAFAAAAEKLRAQV